ncbi:MAG: xanthine dehydrogenase family protein subunit M [bacterium]
MKTFEYVQAKTAQEAVSFLGDEYNESKVLAGGLDLIGELKDHLIEPERLVSLGGIADLDYIRTEGGVAKIGATTTLAGIAGHPDLLKAHAALAEAAAVVGSPQIRNVGTLGGNLCQRPRCWYYRGEFYPCLKKGGAICYSLSGRNYYNAILGGGPSYIVHPSDCAPALIALNAMVRLTGPDGPREMPLDDFFVLPTEILTRENKLKPNEIVTEIEIPAHSLKSTYVKFRQRDGFDWALSAAAVALEMEGGTCKKANIILGGVAPRPWRAKKAEAVLAGKAITEALAAEAAEASVDGAVALSDNGYKIPLTKTLVKEAILKLAA